MNLRKILSILPKWLQLSLIINIMLASMEGIALSQLVSSITLFNENSTLKDILSYTIIFISIFSFLALNNLLGQLLLSKSLFMINNHYKFEYIKCAIRERGTLSDSEQIVSNLMNDYKLIENDYLRLLVSYILNVLIALISSIYIVLLNYKLALVYILCSLMPLVPSFIMQEKIESATNRWSFENKKMLRKIQNILKGNLIIKIYRSYQYADDICYSAIKDSETSMFEMGVLHSKASSLALLCGYLAYLLPLMYSLILLTSGRITLDIVIAMFMASDRVIGPLKNAIIMRQKMLATLPLRRKYMDVKFPSQIGTFDRKKIKNNDIEIMMDKISFSYNQMYQIISDFSMKITSGSRILVTGNSSSGKSTFLDLIQGELSPDKGDITFISNGKQINPKEVYSTISRVYQDSYIFEGTIRDNILLGLKIEDSVILRFIKDLKLDGELGEDCLDFYCSDNGKELSGGQRQRIDIIRALIRKPTILLLDEITSSLDFYNSSIVRKLIYSTSATIIEVAHHYPENIIETFGLDHLHIEKGKILKL